MTVLTALVACGGEVERLADCDDQDCQRAWVIARWEADPGAVAAELAALTDPVARLALLDALVATDPDRTAQVCARLPQGDVASRCQQLKARPHLWQVPDRVIASGATAEDSESAEVAGLRLLQPAAPLPSPWADTAARAVPCAEAPTTCQTQAAKTSAAAGDAAAAAAACNAIDEDRWRQECFFQAADAIAEPPEPARAAAGVRLCLGAPAFLSRCLSHAQWATTTLAPLAPAADAQGWAPLVATVQAAVGEIQAQDAALAASFEGLLWTEALRVGYDNADRVNAAPLAALDPRLAPHVRSAAVRRLLALELTAERDLAGWEARIAAVLADRAPARAERFRPPARSQTIRYAWTEVLPAEAGLSTVPYMNGGMRAVHEDPAIDASICLMEAAALTLPPRAALLEEGLSHADPLVRWTAARLLSDYNSRAPALALRARVETDPLVLARLGTRRGLMPR